MIEAIEISKLYSAGTIRANDSISFSVSPGSIFCLLGPTGAGKTTLIKVLATLILPTSGTARICGHNVVEDPRSSKRRIGLSSGHERSFYYRLSGRDNLRFFGALHGVRPSRLDLRVDKILRDFGLWESSRRKYMHYSTGMKRKLSLARAMVHEPSAYLLDEPTASVDPISREQIHGMIRALKRAEHAILIVTHDMEEAADLGDSVGFLKRGKLIAVGSPDAVRVFQHQTRIEAKLTDIPSYSLLGQLRQLPEVKTIRHEGATIQITVGNLESVLDAVLRTVTSAATIRGLDIQRPTLRHAYLELLSDDDNTR